MAAEKKIVNPSDPFDFSSYLPAGFDPKEMKQIGGLTPIYAAKEAWENKFPPVVGYMVDIELLPEVQMGKEVFIPKMLRINLTAPTKGVMGKGDDRTAVDLKAGDDILVPVSGNLESNKTLIASAKHPSLYFLIGMKLRGQRKVNNMPSPMWDYDVQIHPKGQKRAGTAFALSTSAPVLAQTNDGAVYDTKTGEVVSDGPRGAMAQA